MSGRLQRRVVSERDKFLGQPVNDTFDAAVKPGRASANRAIWAMYILGDSSGLSGSRAVQQFGMGGHGSRRPERNVGQGTGTFPKGIDERRLPPRLGPLRNGAIFLGERASINARASISLRREPVD
jgi:hypothetical protein